MAPLQILPSFAPPGDALGSRVNGADRLEARVFRAAERQGRVGPALPPQTTEAGGRRAVNPPVGVFYEGYSAPKTSPNNRRLFELEQKPALRSNFEAGPAPVFAEAVNANTLLLPSVGGDDARPRGRDSANQIGLVGAQGLVRQRTLEVEIAAREDALSRFLAEREGVLEGQRGEDMIPTTVEGPPRREVAGHRQVDTRGQVAQGGRVPFEHPRTNPLGAHPPTPAQERQPGALPHILAPWGLQDEKAPMKTWNLRAVPLPPPVDKPAGHAGRPKFAGHPFINAPPVVGPRPTGF